MSPHAARVLLLGALVGPLVAHAQDSTGVATTPLGENNGIRIGPGRLHPYLDLEGRLRLGGDLRPRRRQRHDRRRTS